MKHRHPKKEVTSFSSSSSSDSEKRGLKRLSVFNKVDINIEIPMEEKVDSHTEDGCSSCFKALTQCFRR